MRGYELTAVSYGSTSAAAKRNNIETEQENLNESTNTNDRVYMRTEVEDVSKSKSIKMIDWLIEDIYEAADEMVNAASAKDTFNDYSEPIVLVVQ